MFRTLVPWAVISAACAVYNARWKTPPRLYAHLNILQSMLNIMIYGSFDLFFLLFFGVQFLITSLFALQKKAPAMYGAAILSLGLYVPVGWELLRYADRAQVSRFLAGGLPVHFFVTALIMPLILMWLQGLSAFMAYRRAKKDSTRAGVIGGALAFPVLAVVLFAAAWVFFSLSVSVDETAGPSFFPFKNAPVTSRPSLPLYSDGLDQGIRLSAQGEPFFAEFQTLYISAASDLPLVRCDITVSSEESLVGSAELSRMKSSGDTLDFFLAEYPPNPLSLTCLVETGAPVQIQATFYLYNPGDNSLIRRHKTLVLTVGLPVDLDAAG
jgi:hypothetical protein